MLKKINYIHYALEIVNFSMIPIFLIINGYDSPSLFVVSLVCLLLVYPILNLIFMIIKEAKILEYDTPKMYPICMSSMVLIGCLMWYLFYHLDFIYINTYSLWYGFLLLGFALPIFICQIIDKNLKKRNNKNGPRFISNGR